MGKLKIEKLKKQYQMHPLTDAVKMMSYHYKKPRPIPDRGYYCRLTMKPKKKVQKLCIPPKFNVNCFNFIPAADVTQYSTLEEILGRAVNPTLASTVKKWNFDPQDGSMYFLKRQDGCVERRYRTVDKEVPIRPIPNKIQIEDLPFFDWKKVPGKSDAFLVDSKDRPFVEWDEDVVERLHKPTVTTVKNQWNFDSQDASMYYLKRTDPKIRLPFKTRSRPQTAQPPSGYHVSYKDVEFYNRRRRRDGTEMESQENKKYIPMDPETFEKVTKPTIASTTMFWNFDTQDASLYYLKDGDNKVQLPYRTLKPPKSAPPKTRRWVRKEELPFNDEGKILGKVRSGTIAKFVPNAKLWNKELMDSLTAPTIGSITKRYNWFSQDGNLYTLRLLDPKIKMPYKTVDPNYQADIHTTPSKLRLKKEDLQFFDTNTPPSTKKTYLPWKSDVTNRLTKETVNTVSRRFNYDNLDGNLFLLKREDPKIKLPYLTVREADHPVRPATAFDHVKVEDLPFFDKRKKFGQRLSSRVELAKKVYIPWDQDVMEHLTKPTVSNHTSKYNYDAQDATVYYLRRQDPEVKLTYRTVSKDRGLNSTRVTINDLPFLDKNKWPATKHKAGGT